ncbi:hypothetical protein ACFOYU_10015 [Microvirga sp. GCM10011540]|uniref:hypothetical protein n=1 Tax=Microvirga sp. GCM10011540 TaxID=3317338 RepID=UPI00360F9FAF
MTSHEFTGASAFQGEQPGSTGFALVDLDPEIAADPFHYQAIHFPAEEMPVPAHAFGFLVDPEFDPSVNDCGDDDTDDEDRPFLGMGTLPVHCTAPTKPAATSKPTPAVVAQLQPAAELVSEPLATVPALPHASGTAINNDEAEMDGLVPDMGRDIPFTPEWRVSRRFLDALPGLDLSDEKDEVVACVNAVATALARASDFDQDAWVSISRSREWWSAARTKWPEWASHTYMMRALGLLHDAGLAFEDRAVQDEANLIVWKDVSGEEIQGRQSRYRAKSALVEAFRGVNRFARESGPAIRMRNKKGQNVEVRETGHVERMANQVRKYNAFMAKHNVRLHAQDVMCAHPDLAIVGSRSGITITRTDEEGRQFVQHLSPTPSVEIYRSFCRGSFQMGGRAYCWPQALPSELRQKLTIDGHAVCELDFKSLHPTMLYAMRGLRMEGRAYDLGEHAIPGVSEDDIKIALLIAVNAPGRRLGTVKALMKRSMLNEEPWLHDEATTFAIYDALLARHAPIRADFGRDRGVRLMRIDSDIMMAILTRCVKGGIPAFPVHDSVVVPVQHRPVVEDFMRSEWDRRFDGIPIGISCTSLETDLQTLPSLFPSVSPLPLSPGPLDFLEPSRGVEDPLEGFVAPLGGRGSGRVEASLKESVGGFAVSSRPTSRLAHRKAIRGGLEDRLEADDEISRGPGPLAHLKAKGNSGQGPRAVSRPGHHHAGLKISQNASKGRRDSTPSRVPRQDLTGGPAAMLNPVIQPGKVVAVTNQSGLFELSTSQTSALASGRPGRASKAAMYTSRVLGPVPEATLTRTPQPASVRSNWIRAAHAAEEARRAAEFEARMERIRAARLADPLFRETA